MVHPETLTDCSQAGGSICGAEMSVLLGFHANGCTSALENFQPGLGHAALTPIQLLLVLRWDTVGNLQRLLIHLLEA